MHIEVTPHSFIEIQDTYQEAIEWLGSIGFQIERGRLLEYKRILNNLSENFEDDGWGDFDDAIYRKQITTMLLEVRELISIYKGLSFNKKLSNDFKHYIKGPFSAVNENVKSSSNRPRNIGFELYLNAILSNGGFKPIYDTKADLSFYVDNVKFFLEAKRPTSIKNISKLIDDANSQLHKRFSESKSFKAKGLIALDLTKIINPENKVLPVNNKQHLSQLMNNEDKIRIRMYKDMWHKKRHKRTVGVILHYRLLTNFLDRQELNTLKWLGFVVFKDSKELDKVRNQLNQVVQEIC